MLEDWVGPKPCIKPPLRAGSHASQVQIHLRSIHAVSTVKKHGSWDLPIHRGSQVLSRKYDIDVYMAILYGGKAHDTC